MSPESRTIGQKLDPFLPTACFDLAQAMAALARLHAVLAPLAAAAATAQYESYCPEGAMGGNFDDVWNAGQDNGQAHLAAEVLKALAGTTPAADITATSKHAVWGAAYRQGVEDQHTDNEALPLLSVWAEAYTQGIQDEITSQSNPGVAGCFCPTPSACTCFIAPARVNPFSNPQETS